MCSTELHTNREKMGREKDAQLSVRIPKELRDAALEKARREDLHLSQAVRRLLRGWLAEDSPKEKGERPPKDD